MNATRPKLTPHQRETLALIRRYRARLGRPVPAEMVGSRGAVAKLEAKGYVIVTERLARGPQGGRRYLIDLKEGR